MLFPEHTRTTPAHRVMLLGRFAGTNQRRLAQRLARLTPPVVLADRVSDDVDAVFQGARPSQTQRAQVVERGLPVYGAQALRDLLDGARWDDVVRVLDGPDGPRAINDVLTELRAAFAEPPSLTVWERVRGALQACPRDQLDLALDYALSASMAWDSLDTSVDLNAAPRAALVPSPMETPRCPTPRRWYYAMIAGMPDPRLRMTRHLKLGEFVEGHVYNEVYGPQAQQRHALDALGDAGIDRIRWLDASDLQTRRFLSWPVHTVQAFLERQQHLLGISLSNNSLGQTQAKLWLPEPLLARIQALDLSTNSVGRVASEYIADRAEALRWLSLRGCSLRPKALDHWMARLDLRRMVALDLSDDIHDPAALRAALAEPMERLCCLDLGTRYPKRATSELVPLGAMPSLKLLGLSRWLVRGADVAAMTRDAQVEVLDLSGAALRDAEALVRAPSLASLRVLRLNRMQRDRGLLALLRVAAKHAAFPRLEALYIDTHGAIDPALVHALDACTHWQSPELARLREHLHARQADAERRRRS